MKALASTDKDFATKAAEGGMAEVALAELATRQASNEEVKQFAQRIVTDHTQINNELKDWASKNSLTLPSDMGAKHKATHDKLAKLSGANFDREFVREMVKAHDKDVTMFEKQSRDSRDPELKAWAGQKLPTLREHQTLARELAGKVGAGTSTYKKATKS
jgi:putative membrane protein